MRCTTTAFFSKLIVIMWNEQTTFWSAYQERRNSTSTAQDQDTEKLTEIKAEVTYLYSLRHQVHPAHQSTYFPGNLNTFLKHSTHAQLQAYTQNYGHAIKASIKHHKDQAVANTRNIFTYPGFQRNTATQPANPATGNTTDQANIPTQNREGNIPAETSPIPPLPNIQHQDTLGAHRTIADDGPPLIPNEANPDEAMEPTQASPTHSTLPGTTHNAETIIAPPPIPPPPNIPPTDPDEAAIDTQQTRPNARKKIQQTILSTFRRRRTIREITPPQPTAPVGNIPVHFTQQPNNAHTTVGDYINRLNRHPSTEIASATGTEDTNTPPVTATRASPSYKHSKWRPAALVREKFSQYFRKR